METMIQKVDRLYTSKKVVFEMWNAQKNKLSKEILMEKYTEILVNIKRYEALK